MAYACYSLPYALTYTWAINISMGEAFIMSNDIKVGGGPLVDLHTAKIWLLQ